MGTNVRCVHTAFVFISLTLAGTRRGISPEALNVVRTHELCFLYIIIKQPIAGQGPTPNRPCSECTFHSGETCYRSFQSGHPVSDLRGCRALNCASLLRAGRCWWLFSFRSNLFCASHVGAMRSLWCSICEAWLLCFRRASTLVSRTTARPHVLSSFRTRHLLCRLCVSYAISIGSP